MTHPKPPTRALFSPDRQRPDGKALRARLRGVGDGEFDTKGRRNVVIQCDRCLDKGSGTVGPSGRLVSVNLAAEPRGNRDAAIVHRGCGGAFIPYDIADPD